MYCSRCGKQIDYDAIVCNECLAKEEAEKLASQTPVQQPVEQQVNVPVTPVQPEQGYYQQTQSTNEQPLDDGKGRAIAGVVMGGIAAFLSIFAVSITMIYFAIGFVVFCIPTIVLGILAVVNGAKSIKHFIYVKNHGGSKPVGTLIMGIVALALGIEALLCAIIGFFSGILMISVYNTFDGYYY